MGIRNELSMELRIICNPKPLIINYQSLGLDPRLMQLTMGIWAWAEHVAQTHSLVTFKTPMSGRIVRFVQQNISTKDNWHFKKIVALIETGKHWQQNWGVMKRAADESAVVNVDQALFSRSTSTRLHFSRSISTTALFYGQRRWNFLWSKRHFLWPIVW